MPIAHLIVRAIALFNLLATVWALTFASRLDATALFGFISSGSAGVASLPTQSQTWTTGGSPLAVTSYASPVLGNSNSYTIGGSTFNESVHASLTMENGTLHAAADTLGSAGGDSSNDASVAWRNEAFEVQGKWAPIVKRPS